MIHYCSLPGSQWHKCELQQNQKWICGQRLHTQATLMLKIPLVHQVLYRSFFIFQIAISSKLRLFNKEVLSNLHSIKYLFEDDVNVACNQLWYLLSFSGLYGVVAFLILAKILGGKTHIRRNTVTSPVSKVRGSNLGASSGIDSLVLAHLP